MPWVERKAIIFTLLTCTAALLPANALPNQHTTMCLQAAPMVSEENWFTCLKMTSLQAKSPLHAVDSHCNVCCQKQTTRCKMGSSSSLRSRDNHLYMCKRRCCVRRTVGHKNLESQQTTDKSVLRNTLSTQRHMYTLTFDMPCQGLGTIRLPHGILILLHGLETAHQTASSNTLSGCLSFNPVHKSILQLCPKLSLSCWLQWHVSGKACQACYRNGVMSSV